MLNFIGCSRIRHKVQNDLNDWLIDKDNKPTMPVDHKLYTKLGLPIPDPKDIPATKQSEPVDIKQKAIDKKDKVK